MPLLLCKSLIKGQAEPQVKVRRNIADFRDAKMPLPVPPASCRHPVLGSELPSQSEALHNQKPSTATRMVAIRTAGILPA
ncbi:MAG: hypothetical protein ACOC54_03680, partial [Candidatus Sumerlaeota bacterium]